MPSTIPFLDYEVKQSVNFDPVAVGKPRLVRVLPDPADLQANKIAALRLQDLDLVIYPSQLQPIRLPKPVEGQCLASARTLLPAGLRFGRSLVSR